MPTSFMRTFNEPFVEIQNVSFDELESKAGVPKVFGRRDGLLFLSFKGPYDSH